MYVTTNFQVSTLSQPFFTVYFTSMKQTFVLNIQTSITPHNQWDNVAAAYNLEDNLMFTEIIALTSCVYFVFVKQKLHGFTLAQGLFLLGTEGLKQFHLDTQF